MNRRELFAAMTATLLATDRGQAAPAFGSRAWVDKWNELQQSSVAMKAELEAGKLPWELWKRMQRQAKAAGLCAGCE